MIFLVVFTAGSGESDIGRRCADIESQESQHLKSPKKSLKMFSSGE